MAKYGFSKQILETMNSTGVVYEKFDIFQGRRHTEGIKSVLKLANPCLVVCEMMFKIIKYHSLSFGIKSCFWMT